MRTQLRYTTVQGYVPDTYAEVDLYWLNDRWGYEEGGLDLETLRFHTRVHVIHPESPLLD